MSGYHYVKDRDLLAAVRAAANLGGGFPAKKVAEKVAEWLSRQRTAPDLVGSTAAAAILGVQPPHITKLKERGRMPEGIPVEGSNDVYVREEVEALAEELNAQRAERARRRAEREAAAS